MPRIIRTPDRPSLQVLPESPAHREHRLSTQEQMIAITRSIDWISKAHATLSNGPLWRKVSLLSEQVGCTQGYLATIIRRSYRSSEFAWGNLSGRASLIALASRVTDGEAKT